MIRKSVKRFSEKIMLNQGAEARWRFNQISSRFGEALPSGGPAWQGKNLLFLPPRTAKSGYSVSNMPYSWAWIC